MSVQKENIGPAGMAEVDGLVGVLDHVEFLEHGDIERGGRLEVIDLGAIAEEEDLGGVLDVEGVYVGEEGVEAVAPACALVFGFPDGLAGMGMRGRPRRRRPASTYG